MFLRLSGECDSLAMDGGVPMVQSLVGSGTSKVPPRFVRATEDRPSAASVGNLLDELPIINAADLDKQDGLASLDKACREWGFFHLVGHGISSSLIRSTREVINAFFQLPQDEKELYSTSVSTSFEGYGRYFLPSKDTPLDWGDTFVHLIPPMGIQWPCPPAEYKETIEAYGHEVRSLANKLLAAMSKALNQQPDFLVDALGPNARTALRMNYYPPCPEPDLVLGLSPHSDATCITILLQDEVEGLQIKKDGHWKSVKSTPDAFVVNIGDMLEIMTNGTYQSVEHRAIVNHGKPRISAATFYSPGFEKDLKPLLVDTKPMFREISMREFVDSYLNGQLNGKGHLKSVKIV